MGLIKTIITIAICIAVFCLVANLLQIPDDEYDCLEEIAEDYCEDNGMLLSKVYISIEMRKVFTCEEDERSFSLKAYKFLEDEIEECKNE